MKRKNDNVIGFAVIHGLAALAFVPWFFSWTGVILLVAGMFVFGLIGINLGYHRLLTHRGLACPRWLERSFALIGVCSMQDSPGHWVAVHRRHHQFADEEQDPHSPAAGFFWAHMNWLLVKSEALRRGPLLERYARDIQRDPLYAWLERHSNWMKVALGSWLIFYLAGLAASLASGSTLWEASRFGLSLLVWGAALRTVVVWHVTWAVNSACHVWGYRTYGTPDRSRNNPVIGLLAHGEGWHNNHHADPRSARHGHRWWELDTTWLAILLLRRLGLAKDVALPSPLLTRKYADSSSVDRRATLP